MPGQGRDRQRATLALIEAFERMGRPGQDRPDMLAEDIELALLDGADPHLSFFHPRTRGQVVCALGVAIEHPRVVQALLDHGARFDHTLPIALGTLVSRGPWDITTSLRAPRTLDGPTIDAVQAILQAGPAPGFQVQRFLDLLDDVVEDRTTRGYPDRRLREILDDQFEGFEALRQQLALGAGMAAGEARQARRRL